MIPAGKLRNRCVFQVETQVPDGGGGYELGWAAVTGGAVRGRYLPASPREDVRAGRLEAAEAGVLTVRSSSVTRAITSANRVLIDDIAYAIKGGPTDFDQRREALDFKVERGVAS
ncbi:head-tail adaptor protein [Pleomorphomonas oryzae]|uniref:head-tail adaptor protein n=1 Tax=Pleomorphomonas oryzae TaxID=261934 RepID=UPI00040ECB77|nr:head-tail adaptor protein [Pleomorphomonas oryzae]